MGDWACYCYCGIVILYIVIIVVFLVRREGGGSRKWVGEEGGDMWLLWWAGIDGVDVCVCVGMGDCIWIMDGYNMLINTS